MDSNFQYAGAVKRAVTPALETGRRALFADHFIGYPTEGYAFGNRGGRVTPPAADRGGLVLPLPMSVEGSVPRSACTADAA